MVLPRSMWFGLPLHSCRFYLVLLENLWFAFLYTHAGFYWYFRGVLWFDLPPHSCRFLLVLLRNFVQSPEVTICLICLYTRAGFYWYFSRNFVHSPEVTICLVCLYTRVGFNWYSRGFCGLVCLHTRVIIIIINTVFIRR